MILLLHFPLTWLISPYQTWKYVRKILYQNLEDVTIPCDCLITLKGYLLCLFYGVNRTYEWNLYVTGDLLNKVDIKDNYRSILIFLGLSFSLFKDVLPTMQDKHVSRQANIVHLQLFCIHDCKVFIRIDQRPLYLPSTARTITY